MAKEKMTIERALEIIKDELPFESGVINEALELIESSLEKLVPKKPKCKHEEYLKHSWKKDDDGIIDLFAWDSGYHNGPVCERCGAAPCMHCTPDYDNKKCKKNKYTCPNCGKEIDQNDSLNSCKFCLQALDWSKK